MPMRRTTVFAVQRRFIIPVRLFIPCLIMSITCKCQEISAAIHQSLTHATNTGKYLASPANLFLIAFTVFSSSMLRPGIVSES